jgi:hypothetical protein
VTRAAPKGVRDAQVPAQRIAAVTALSAASWLASPLNIAVGNDQVCALASPWPAASAK